jgi:hypothetical protein
LRLHGVSFEIGAARRIPLDTVRGFFEVAAPLRAPSKA